MNHLYYKVAFGGPRKKAFHLLTQTAGMLFLLAIPIRLNLETDGITSLTVYDLTGRQLYVLVNGYLPRGNSTVIFDRKELAPGTYVLKLEQKGKLVTRQLVKQ